MGGAVNDRGAKALAERLVARQQMHEDLLVTPTAEANAILGPSGLFILDVTALRTVLEAEWYNGNIPEGSYDRIMAVCPDLEAGA